MFTAEQLTKLKNNEEYVVLISNMHDVRIRSRLTGQEWTIVSNYATPGCYILHRHSPRFPFHRQHGGYDSLESAMEYIHVHDENYALHHGVERKTNKYSRR